MDTQQDYFELFGLPRQFDIDLQQLAERYRAIQQEVHPDRHSAGGDQQRRLAMQYSSRANDAYQCLKSMVRRAAYLLELAGQPCQFDNHTLADADFLMQQMDLREQLADAGDVTAAEALLAHVQALLQREQQQFVSTYSQRDYQKARDSVSRLHFLDKFEQQAEQKIEDLDND